MVRRKWRAEKRRGSEERWVGWWEEEAEDVMATVLRAGEEVREVEGEVRAVKKSRRVFAKLEEEEEGVRAVEWAG